MRAISRHALRLAILGSLLIALPVLVAAQGIGALRGTIVDIRGDPLPGVIVEISGTRDGPTRRAAVTNVSGVFIVPALSPGGSYEVRSTFPGHATVVMPDVAISAGRVTNLKIIMQPAEELSERIEVRARPQIVELETTTTETRFSSEFVDALPILGRNYQDILTLAPGVSDVDGDGNPNIHGARDTDVVTLVDGISIEDPLTGKVGAQLNIESIQEIELKTAGASAEFGRAQGGFTNIVTKSGGNEFQGTFKFFWRGSTLDGDGAGSTDPLLRGGLGESGLRDLEFNDYYPFLAMGGPIARDHAWYFMALEYIQVETPVNALTRAFVASTEAQRNFAKITWQASTNHRVALSVNVDPQALHNVGVNSRTREETGFTLEQGGTLVSLKGVSILSPTVALDTTVGYFKGRPDLIPNSSVDTNGNGVLYFDRNNNGFFEARERDVGEDLDHDGAFDVWEDTLIADGQLSWVIVTDPDTLINYELSEDLDHDGKLTAPGACEGDNREDIDCDGYLDRINEDRNRNGRLDRGEDMDGDHRLDLGIEDRNGNRVLDDVPFPASKYPYGRLQPLVGDRDYTDLQTRGVVIGPYFEEYSDERERFSWRQDLGVFVDDWKGSHDLQLGYRVERDSFHRARWSRDILLKRDSVEVDCWVGPSGEEQCIAIPPTTVALLPTNPLIEASATGLSGSLYVQDTYKPRPNLTIGLGLRFDREATDTSGYSFFDPRIEAASQNRLLALTGVERGGGRDLSHGNGDGIQSAGITTDPMFQDLNPDAYIRTPGAIIDSLYKASLARLTRHRSTIGFTLRHLGSVFPDIIDADGNLDEALLADLGVRFQTPEEFRITNDNLAPRLSISWDPWADGRTKLFATWGRYYDSLFLSTIVGESDPERIARYYLRDPDGLDYIGIGGRPGEPLIVHAATPNNHIGQLIARAPPSITQVDRNLRTPFSDELTIGVERELAPELSFAIRYIDRTFRDQLQDVDINHERRLDPTTGQPLDVLGRLKVVSTGDEITIPNFPVPDGRPDLFIKNFFFNQVLRIGNFNEARYKAIEVELRKRVSSAWQLQASYTYSRAQGHAEDFQSLLGNDPSTVESEYGYLDFDQRHVVKINATTFLPGDWQLGWTASWSSGLPYSIAKRFFAADNVNYQQYRTAYGFSSIEGGTLHFKPLPRNSERNDSVYDLNLRVKKSFVLGRTSAALFLEVHNVLNSDDLRIFMYEPDKGGDSITGNDAIVADPLQLNAERRFGRRFQVGFQFDF